MAIGYSHSLSEQTRQRIWHVEYFFRILAMQLDGGCICVLLVDKQTDSPCEILVVIRSRKGTSKSLS